VPKLFSTEFKEPTDAWTRRIQSGGAQSQMARDIGTLESSRALTEFASWTGRIEKGEIPSAKPDRPQGIERNIVVSEWDWGRTDAYLHDLISTDRRNPKLNANGKSLRLAGGFDRLHSDPRPEGGDAKRGEAPRQGSQDAFDEE